MSNFFKTTKKIASNNEEFKKNKKKYAIANYTYGALTATSIMIIFFTYLYCKENKFFEWNLNNKKLILILGIVILTAIISIIMLYGLFVSSSNANKEYEMILKKLNLKLEVIYYGNGGGSISFSKNPFDIKDNCFIHLEDIKNTEIEIIKPPHLLLLDLIGCNNKKCEPKI